MKTLGTASVAALRQYVRAAESAGVDINRLFDQAELDQNILDTDDGRINGEQFQHFIRLPITYQSNYDGQQQENRKAASQSGPDGHVGEEARDCHGCPYLLEGSIKAWFCLIFSTRQQTKLIHRGNLESFICNY